jgi:hypothetical protein
MADSDSDSEKELVTKGTSIGSNSGANSKKKHVTSSSKMQPARKTDWETETTNGDEEGNLSDTDSDDHEAIFTISKQQISSTSRSDAVSSSKAKKESEGRSSSTTNKKRAGDVVQKGSQKSGNKKVKNDDDKEEPAEVDEEEEVEKEAEVVPASRLYRSQLKGIENDRETTKRNISNITTIYKSINKRLAFLGIEDTFQKFLEMLHRVACALPDVSYNKFKNKYTNVKCTKQINLFHILGFKAIKVRERQ